MSAALKSDRSARSRRTKKSTTGKTSSSKQLATEIDMLCDKMEQMDDEVYWQKLFTWSENFNRRRFEFQQCEEHFVIIIPYNQIILMTVNLYIFFNFKGI